jgi:hypothetical protein
MLLRIAELVTQVARHHALEMPMPGERILSKSGANVLAHLKLSD